MPRPDAPGPMLRRGPRPLAMHLLSATTSPPSASSSTGSSGASPGWNPASATPALPPGIDPAFIAGVAAYRRHPYRRAEPGPMSVLWSCGDMRVLDYGQPGGRPVLFVPSLINRGYILDLMPGRSMLRHLAAQGLRPLLLEWGWPGEDERRLDVGGYVQARLEPALADIADQCGQPVTVAGYCMGGLLALAAAQRRPDLVRALVLLATPWDFGAASPEAIRTLSRLLAPHAGMMALTGTLPIDALQTAFAAVDPASIIRKFRDFGALPQEDPRTALYVAMEDWLSDGVPLAAPVAIDCVRDWYGANLPMQGAWQVGGTEIQPQRLSLPTLVVVPARDRIVPPGSALPLAGLIPGATLLQVAGGHVGMVAGPRAEGLLWTPLTAWLQQHA
ncbi:alpha/beta fold hydrolase [Gluconacetobacter azotocaptans]|uniref:Alpha/beta fold hydrolase n=3 Tax=Gluconacetobacter azotocaptans TaxID=142834 RepID=A0A7W4JS56_9PROT|nr:alpha/beta fold hydrolase [Gluconacetobacter azotocaptans]